MELRHYTNVLLKWWWLIAAAVAVAVVSSYLGSLATPKTYQSRTTLMVGTVLQNPNPNQAEIYTGQALAQSYSDLVRREPIMRAVLTSLNLPWDWAVLQNMVSSRVVPGTQLIEIAVLDTDPQRAKVLAEEVANQLIKQSPSGTNPEKDAQQQFIRQQIDELQTNIKNANGEIRQLDQTIAQATSARQIQDARARQESLQQQITTWQSTYAQLLTNLQQSSTNFLQVVEEAQTPTSPVGSGTLTNVLLAAAIGLVLSGGAAFVLEYLDDTIKSAEDVQQVMGLTTLGGVARIDGDDYTSKLITVTQPRSPTSEAYRMLRTNLQFSEVDRPLQTLLVTSANPEEGKSLTAANVAVVLAQAGRHVTLVDADLRRPTQDTIFKLNNARGLTTILLDTAVTLADVVQNTPIENLKVMTSGPVPPNPSELLGSKRMGYLIEALQKQSDLIIFDSPPVLAVADASVLATRLDGVLLVVDAGHTRRPLARRAVAALQAVNAHVLGVMLNRVDTKAKGYGYYYYDDAGPRRASNSPATVFNNIAARFSRSSRTPTPARQAKPGKPTS
jgi:non-specific protein-tyrosine kinase